MTLHFTGTETSFQIPIHPTTQLTQGQLFSYQLQVTDDSPQLSYQLRQGPAGMTLSSSGLLQWQADSLGSKQVSLEVSDGQYTASQQFTLTVNQAHKVIWVDVQNLNQNSLVLRWKTNNTATANTSTTAQSFAIAQQFNGVWADAQIISTTTNEASYTDLAPGRYRFRVSHCQATVCQNNKTSASIHISDAHTSETIDTSVDESLVTNQAVGATAGIFKVSPQGAATYSVALNLPAGVADVTPSVSLHYSSHSAGHLLGLGWRLQAGSAITRCGKNQYFNGEQSTVQINAHDRFCYNGQQLVLNDNSDEYGADGTQYHLAIDDMSTFTVHKSNIDPGPAYFTMTTKAGDTWYFGNTADSFVEPDYASDVAKWWSLNKVSDIAGNIIEYHYLENQAVGEHRLQRIEYGANESVTTSRHFAQIHFGYINNPQPRSGYSAGARIADNHLLETVTATIDEQIYRQYTLDYTLSNLPEANNYLESITECISETECVAPVSFTWQRQFIDSATVPLINEYCEDDVCVQYPSEQTELLSLFHQATDIDGPAPSGQSNWQVSQTLDFNGDGYADIVYQDNGWRIAYGPTLEQSIRVADVHDSESQPNRWVIDIDGNGSSDLLFGEPYDDGNDQTTLWTVVRYHASGVQTYSLGLPALDPDSQMQLVDVTGDGLTDILFVYGGAVQYYPNQTDWDSPAPHPQFGPAVALLNLSALKTNKTVSLADSNTHARLLDEISGDFNGDGMADIIVAVTQENGFCHNYPEVDSPYQCEVKFDSIWEPNSQTDYQVYFQGNLYHTLSQLGNSLRSADLNGDGLSDLLYRKGKLDNDQTDDSQNWFYRLSTGKPMTARTGFIAYQRAKALV